MFSPFSFSMSSSTHRLIALGEELIKSGNTVSIVLPSYDRHSGFKVKKTRIFNSIDLVQPYQPSFRVPQLSTLPYIISSFLKEAPLHYDIVHVLKPLPINFAPFLLKPFKRTPIVQDMDDLDHTVMISEGHSASSVEVVRRCEIVLPNLANHITTCSSLLQNIYLNMGFNKDQVTWLPNGVKTSDFNVCSDLTLKARLGLREKVIVYLGWLNNQYQVYPLLKATELIVKERKDVSILIIGDGISRPYFEELTRNLRLTEYVNFIGSIPYTEVARYLSVCDLGFACCPPQLISTGGALKIFMYMASGLPVIVNPVGDLPYYINYGDAGVVSKLDPDNLSGAFLDLLKDDKLRKQKGVFAKRFVKNNFDWAVLSKKLLAIYNSLN